MTQTASMQEVTKNMTDKSVDDLTYALVKWK